MLSCYRQIRHLPPLRRRGRSHWKHASDHVRNPLSVTGSRLCAQRGYHVRVLLRWHPSSAAVRAVQDHSGTPLPPSVPSLFKAPLYSTPSTITTTRSYSSSFFYLFQWVSPLKYSYTAMVESYFRGTPANTYVEMMDVTQPSGAGVNLGCLLVFFIAYNVISYWGLHNLYRTKR